MNTLSYEDITFIIREIIKSINDVDYINGILAEYNFSQTDIDKINKTIREID